MNQADQNLLYLYKGLPESSFSLQWLKNYLIDEAAEHIRTKNDGVNFYKSKTIFTFEEMVRKYSKNK